MKKEHRPDFICSPFFPPWVHTQIDAKHATTLKFPAMVEGKAQQVLLPRFSTYNKAIYFTMATSIGMLSVVTCPVGDRLPVFWSIT